MLLIVSEHKAEIEPFLKTYPFFKKSNLFLYADMAIFINYGKGALSLSYNVVDILSKRDDINMAVLFGFSGAVNKRLKTGDMFTLKRVKLMHNKKPLFNPVDMPVISELPSVEGVTILDGYETDNEFLRLFADSVDKESYFFAKAVKSINKFGLILRVVSDDNTKKSMNRVKQKSFSYDVAALKDVFDRLALIENDEVMLEAFRHTAISNINILKGLKKLIGLRRLSFSKRQQLYKKIIINNAKKEPSEPEDVVFVENGVDRDRIKLNIKEKRVLEIDDYVSYFHNLKDKKGVIFANKKGEFLRKTPDCYTPDRTYGYSILNAYNCIYDCSYCFLKGYFKSFNPVIFLNYEDYFAAIEDIVNKDKKRPLYFYSGTFSDSLVVDMFCDFNKELVEFFARKISDKDVFLEMRTKSNNIKSLLNIKPNSNIIVAFSLSPQSAIDEFERFTPSLEKRFDAIKEIDKKGYKIGIRLDPIFADRLDEYKPILEMIKTISHLHSVEIGFLRYDKSNYDNLMKKNPSVLKNLVYEDRMYRHNKEIRKKSIEFFNNYLDNFYLSME